MNTLLVFFCREFLRLGNPLNCGAWDKKLLKQYRVHKPSSLGYDAEMRSKSIKSESQWHKSRVLCCLVTSESILKSHYFLNLNFPSAMKHMVIVSFLSSFKFESNHLPVTHLLKMIKASLWDRKNNSLTIHTSYKLVLTMTFSQQEQLFI